MNLDYSNLNENIFFAAFENDMRDYSGNEFTVVGSAPTYREDAVVGKYMEVPQNTYLVLNNAQLAVGTGDFTLDFWAYSFGKSCSVTTASRTIGVVIAAYPSFASYTRQIAAIGNINQSEIVKLSNYKAEKWVHYAFVRKDSVCYAFVNGILQGTVNSARSVAAQKIALNNDHTDTSAGSFCESKNYYKAVRFCSFARWTEDFIPPNPKNINTEADPTDMKLHILLKISQTVNLTGYMWPVGNNPTDLTWSSEDAAIASVDQSGTVTANAAGKTKIFVQNEDGSFKAFARIKVVEEGEDELLLSILLEIGEECVLVPEFDPQEAETAVLWSSSDTSIATVNAVGKVTGIAAGLSIITAKTADNKLTDSMYVTVKA